MRRREGRSFSSQCTNSNSFVAALAHTGNVSPQAIPALTGNTSSFSSHGDGSPSQCSGSSHSGFGY